MYLALERYSRPTSIEECLRLLAEPGQRAAVLSGGTDLNAGGHEAVTHVVDVQALPGIGAITRRDAAIELGARVTLGRVRRDAALDGPLFAALREAAAAFAVLAVQNRATLGGRVMTGRADQDVLPALVALGAKLHVAKLEGGRVALSVVDAPAGHAARAALEGAVVIAIEIPLGEGASALRRFGRTAVDVPLATVAATRRGASVRLAANQQGPSAADLRRLGTLEKLASSWGAARPASWRADARAAALEDLAAYADPWASADYRRDLSATLAVRALAAVLGEPEIV
jgi:carbon-monoxide dehydrogenase medium subunit